MDAVKGKGFDIGLARNQAATGGYSTGYEYQYATDPTGFLAKTKNIWGGANRTDAFFAQFPNLAKPFGYTAHPLTQEQVAQNGMAVAYSRYSAVESSLPKLGTNQYYTSGPNGNLIVKTFANNGVLGYNYTSADPNATQGVVPSIAIPSAAASVGRALASASQVLSAAIATAAAKPGGLSVAAIAPDNISASGRTTAARTARFINAPGVGALEAGVGSTVVRFAGQLDPEASEIRILRTELQTANAKIVGYEAEVVSLMRQLVNQGKHISSYPPNKQVSVGGGRS